MIMIGIIVLIVLIYLKFENKLSIKTLAVLAVALMLYFSVTGVLSYNDVSLDSPKGIIRSVYLYFGWLGSTISGLWDVGTDTVETAGNVIKINNSES